MMGIANRLMHETEALFGAVIDLFGGRGGDGVYGSSAENFYRPEEAQTPVINIHTDAVTMNAATVQAERDAAPVQEVTPAATRELSVEDWFHATREQAQADALRSSAEARADADIAAGREQSLHALAVDPVGFYAQRDAQEAAFYDAMRQQQGAEQDQQLSMRR
jgi:hypothetical protein